MCHRMKTFVLFAVASPAPRIVQKDRFAFYMSSYFGGRQYPNIISHMSKLNYTCGVFQSSN